MGNISLNIAFTCNVLPPIYLASFTEMRKLFELMTWAEIPQLIPSTAEPRLRGRLRSELREGREAEPRARQRPRQRALRREEGEDEEESTGRLSDSVEKSN